MKFRKAFPSFKKTELMDEVTGGGSPSLEESYVKEGHALVLCAVSLSYRNGQKFRKNQ